MTLLKRRLERCLHSGKTWMNVLSALSCAALPSPHSLFFPSHLYIICSIVNMFKPKKCGGKEEYKFLKHFATNSKLKVIRCTCPGVIHIILYYIARISAVSANWTSIVAYECIWHGLPAFAGNGLSLAYWTFRFSSSGSASNIFVTNLLIQQVNLLHHATRPRVRSETVCLDMYKFQPAGLQG